MLLIAEQTLCKNCFHKFNSPKEILDIIFRCLRLWKSAPITASKAF